MDKIYKGLRENGVWEEFASSTREAAEPQNSGYEKVIEVETGEEVKDTQN